MTDDPTPLRKDARRIAGMFDAIAPRYDTLNRLLSAGFDRRWRARAIDALALSGLALAAISQPGACARRVVGVDFAGAMLSFGAAKLHKHPAGASVRLVRGDASKIPLADASAEAVTIGFGIRNVDDTLEACREIHRILRPGGRLAILEFGMPSTAAVRGLYRWYFTRALPRVGRLVSRHAEAYAYLPASVKAFLSPSALSALLAESGFEDVRAIPLSFGVVYLHLATRRDGAESGDHRAAIIV
jgi:demethylmenaquinone methyltransferase/2-methoxy-6-polyprenyl-1,4-benzoquinol methylase